jgi:hypothetical protein
MDATVYIALIDSPGKIYNNPVSTNTYRQQSGSIPIVELRPQKKQGGKGLKVFYFVLTLGTGTLRSFTLCPRMFRPRKIRPVHYFLTFLRPLTFHPCMSHNQQNFTNYVLVGHLA